MDRRPWLVMLLVGLVCLGTVPPAGAQTDIDQKRAKSHAKLPGPQEFGPEQAREFLADRLRDTHDLAELQKNFPALEKLAREILQHPDRFPLNPKDKGLVEYLRQTQPGLGAGKAPDLNNPAIQELLNRFLDRQQRQQMPGLEVSPEQLDAWKKLLDLPGGFGPSGGGPAEGPVPPPVGRPFQPEQPPGSPARPTGRPFSPSLPPNVRPEPPQSNSWLNMSRLRSWSEMLARQEAVRNSGALQNAVRDLTRRVLAEGESGNSEKPPGSVSEYLHLDRYWPKSNWQPSTSWLPRVNPGAFQPPSGFTVPRPDLATSSRSLWEGIVWVLLFAVFAFAGWRLRAWHQAHRNAADAWKVGPWPVDPTAVATRQELIQAFEHLSLLRFGKPAFTWNHLEIAGRLARDEGGGEAERRSAAQRLAALYEHARYAPQDGPLADADLAAARRDLCFLAGAPAA
jgi:hypothetical protein